MSQKQFSQITEEAPKDTPQVASLQAELDHLRQKLAKAIAHATDEESQKWAALAKVDRLKKALKDLFNHGNSMPYAQWTREQHAAYNELEDK